jgi:hypothetical protein
LYVFCAVLRCSLFFEDESSWRWMHDIITRRPLVAS